MQEIPKPITKRKAIMVYMEKDLWTACRHLAVDRQCTGSQIVEQAIREHLAANEKG